MWFASRGNGRADYGRSQEKTVPHPAPNRRGTQNSMATDYDAPRKTDEDAESIEALKERGTAKGASSIDSEDADNPSFDLGGSDLSDVELDVVVLPQQDDEFTCVSCFLVRHRSQMDHETELGPICAECAG
ncbi:hypothetical protein GCM10027033_06430 [Leucobacter ruminantium]